MFERIQIDGLAALEADELCPFTKALFADDCVVDDGAIRTRPGYRLVTPTVVGVVGATQDAYWPNGYWPEQFFPDGYWP